MTQTQNVEQVPHFYNNIDLRKFQKQSSRDKKLNRHCEHVIRNGEPTTLTQEQREQFIQIICGNPSFTCFGRICQTMYSDKEHIYEIITPGSDFYVFESDFIRELEQIQGITGIDFTYFYAIQMGSIYSDRVANTLPGYIYGVSKEWAAMMNEKSNMSIDVDAFNHRKEAVIRDIWKNKLISKDSAKFVIGDTLMKTSVGIR